MRQLFTFKYWFLLKGELMPISRYALIALIIALIGAVVYFKMNKEVWKKTLWKKTFEEVMTFCSVNFVAGLYLYFVSDQVIPVLSARMWFLIWFIEMAIWGYEIYKGTKVIPERRKEIEAKRELNKYIP